MKHFRKPIGKDELIVDILDLLALDAGRDRMVLRLGLGKLNRRELGILRYQLRK